MRFMHACIVVLLGAWLSACGAADEGSNNAPLFADHWYTAQAAGRRAISSPIEIRLMGDESARNENTHIYTLTLYVR